MEYIFFNGSPRIFAHRGDSLNFPENTMPAFKNAAVLGVDCIETDVHITRDGRCILWHDDTIELTPGKKERISLKNWAELKTFDAGAAFTKDNGKTHPFKGKGIPLVLLEELLESLPGIRFNIDLKDRSEKLVKEFIRIIKDHKAADRILGGSFHHGNLVKLRKLLPEFPTAFSEQEARRVVVLQKLGLLRFTRKLPGQAFQVPEKNGNITIVTKKMIKELHRRGIPIHVWTVNKEEDMRRLFKMGVDGIFTDNPGLLIKTIKEME